MRFSKSMLIFLFVSLSAYYYAYKRTNGNVLRSALFTTYCLAIKIGFFLPTVDTKLNYHQANPQLVSTGSYRDHL